MYDTVCWPGNLDIAPETLFRPGRSLGRHKHLDAPTTPTRYRPRRADWAPAYPAQPLTPFPSLYMNIPACCPAAAAAPPMAEEDDSINLLDLLDVVIEQPLGDGCVTAAALVVGGGYALTATPIYEANT